MARRERTVTCPHCSAERTTRAAGGMRLRCPSCANAYRAPAPPAADELPEGRPAAPAAEPAPSGSGITVVDASSTSARAAAAPSPTDEPPPAKPAGQERAKAKGRLGGRQRAKALGRIGGRR